MAGMRFKYLYITLLLCFSMLGYAKGGNSKMDSLNNAYHTTKNDTNRIWALLNMADMIYSQNTDSAKQLWSRATQLCDKALRHDSLYPVNSIYTHRLIYIKS